MAETTDLESGVSRLLQAGVALAAGCMVVGGALYLARQGAEVVSYGKFHSVPAELKSIPLVWRGLVAGQAAAIIQFGAIVMIATPVLRVAYLVVAFGLRRDWLYLGISLIVLALLTWALAGAA